MSCPVATATQAQPAINDWPIILEVSVREDPGIDISVVEVEVALVAT